MLSSLSRLSLSPRQSSIMQWLVFLKMLLPRSYLSSSSWRSLQSFEGLTDYALLSQRLSAVWSSGFSPHEQDACTPPRQLQAWLYPQRLVPLCLLIEVCSHLLQEKILDPPALALKADELFQSRISYLVNLLAGQLEDVHVNAVPSRAFPTPSTRCSPTPALSSGSSSSPGPCWFHKKHDDKAQNCWKPCSESEK